MLMMVSNLQRNIMNEDVYADILGGTIAWVMRRPGARKWRQTGRAFFARDMAARIDALLAEAPANAGG